MNSAPLDSGDTEELEALFDSIVNARAAEECQAAPQTASEGAVYREIGQIARQLFDALRDLGYDKSLERAAAAMPDARDRLSYVIELTEQAAQRALNAIEAAKPIHDTLAKDADRIGGLWTRLFEGKLSVDEFKVLAKDTHEYLRALPGQARAANEQLTEIMMAQDFQDLTGQVIKKIVDIVRDVEARLLELLVENSQAPVKLAVPERPLEEGPVVRPGARSDVLTSQKQVDELLESLGF